MAASKQTTVRHIERNRIADLTAKEFATTLSAVQPEVQQRADQAALEHQKWPVKLHELLPTNTPSSSFGLPEPEPDIDQLQYQAQFPQWDWNASVSSFRWKPKIPLSCPSPSSWSGTDEEWRVICEFLRGLRWKVQEDAVTSLCELTALFHSLGYKLGDDSCTSTYLDYHKKIRRAVVLLGRSDNCNHSRGRWPRHWPKLPAAPCLKAPSLERTFSLTMVL